MKTRFWKQHGDSQAIWRTKPDGSLEYNCSFVKAWTDSITDTEELEKDPASYIECTSDGTPLSEVAADRVTLAEFDAFAARIRANLALLEKEGER